MILSLDRSELLQYTSQQLNNFYPDKNRVDLNSMHSVTDLCFDRLHHCFKHVAFDRYNKNGETIFNHLYADHYLMYVWFLGNTIWKEVGDPQIASKLYYLNKTLHGLDCMYDTALPDIFLLFHSAGTMLGKASYADYFVALQGCTVGSHKGKYPVFGKGVSLTANASVVGDCNLGNRSTVSTRTVIFSKNLEADHTAFMNFDTGRLEIKATRQCYAQQFFNTDLSAL